MLFQLQKKWRLDSTPVNIGVREFFPDLTTILKLRNPQRVLCARQGMLTLHEDMIPLLFCKGVRGFQAFVLFVYVLSFSLFQICLVSLDYALLISHMGIRHWTLRTWSDAKLVFHAFKCNCLSKLKLKLSLLLFLLFSWVYLKCCNKCGKSINS